jgi:Fe-S cluster biogenesis protein NfuA
MSSGASTTARTEAELRADVESFMRRNFPQIAMHGGTAGVEGVDAETGEVWVGLGGACSGCGISPMTVQALETRLVADVEGIEVVHASTGADYGEPDFSDVPF